MRDRRESDISPVLPGLTGSQKSWDTLPKVNAMWQRAIVTKRAVGIQEGGHIVSEGAQRDFLEERAF